MTPGIILLKKANIAHIIHEYSHDSAIESYGAEASEKMGVAQEKIFKTLVIELSNQELAVGIVPVGTTLSLKKIAKALGAKNARMAKTAEVERTTGYVLGGISPLGQKKRLRTILDNSAQNYANIFVSAGRRGLEIELAPEDLLHLTNGRFAPIQQQ